MSTLPAFPLFPPTQPAAAHYLATSTWENYAAGDYQATTTTKILALRVQPVAQGLVLTLEAGPPTLRTLTDPPPLAELAQRLAALYARLELLLTPAGEITELLNYTALRQAGEQLLTELQDAAAPSDQLTATLLTFVGRQVASPVALLHSLQFDYLYQALLLTLVGPQLDATRQFAGFFDKTALWFTELTVAEPSTEAGLLPLRLHGSLDPQRTNLTAVKAHQAKALKLATALPSQPLAVLPAPHFCYEAAYSLELATGLPWQIELTVYARAGQLLNKEYHFTLARL